MAIRTIATSILSIAIRHAAPEPRDWGKAMLREMDFVENDWEALFWAVGSVSAILRGVDVPVTDLTPLRLRAQNFENWTRRCNMLAGSLHSLELAVLGSCIFICSNPLQRIGAFLIVSGAVLDFGLQLYQRTRPISSSDSLNSIRATLKRQFCALGCANITSEVAGLTPVGWGLFGCGFMSSHPEVAQRSYCMAAFFLAVLVLGYHGVMFNLASAYKYKHLMKDLDALEQNP